MSITRSVSTPVLSAQGITNPARISAGTTPKSLVRSLTSVGEPRATFGGGNAGPLSSMPSISAIPSTPSTTGLQPQLQPAAVTARAGPLFRDVFRETALEKLFDGNGSGMDKNCAMAKKLLSDSSNTYAQQNIADFAQVYLSLLSVPGQSPENIRNIQSAADCYIEAICADGLGEKSMFGAMFMSKSTGYRNRLDMEDNLIQAGNLGESSARDVLGESVKLAAVAHINQYSENLLGEKRVVTLADIPDLINAPAAYGQQHLLMSIKDSMKAGKITLSSLVDQINLLTVTPQLLKHGTQQPADPAEALATPTGATPAASTAPIGVRSPGNTYIDTINSDHSTVSIDDHTSNVNHHHHHHSGFPGIELRRTAAGAPFVPKAPVSAEVDKEADNELQNGLRDNAIEFSTPNYPNERLLSGTPDALRSVAKRGARFASGRIESGPKTSNGTALPKDLTAASLPPVFAGSEDSLKEYSEASLLKFSDLKNFFEKFVLAETTGKPTPDSKASRLAAGQPQDQPYGLADLETMLLDKAAKSGSRQGVVTHAATSRKVELTVNRNTEARTRTGGRVSELSKI